METVTISRIAHFTNDKNGNPLVSKKTGKPYTRCLIDTTDGRKLSGFGNQTTSNWNEGMEVEIEVSESNGFLNFALPKQNTGGGGMSEQDREMLRRIDHTLAQIAPMISKMYREQVPQKVAGTDVNYPDGSETDAQAPSPFDGADDESIPF